MEEGILSFLLPGEFVYIINDQYINHLVKMEKIIFIVVPDGIHKLGLELIGIYVQNGLSQGKAPSLQFQWPVPGGFFPAHSPRISTVD